MGISYYNLQVIIRLVSNLPLIIYPLIVRRKVEAKFIKYLCIGSTSVTVLNYDINMTKNLNYRHNIYISLFRIIWTSCKLKQVATIKNICCNHCINHNIILFIHKIPNRYSTIDYDIRVVSLTDPWLKWNRPITRYQYVTSLGRLPQ